MLSDAPIMQGVIIRVDCHCVGCRWNPDEYDLYSLARAKKAAHTHWEHTGHQVTYASESWVTLEGLTSDSQQVRQVESVHN